MKVNTAMLIESIKAQAIGESLGKIIKGETIDSIREKYGAYGFSIDDWHSKKEHEKLHIGEKTQLTLFSLNGLVNCIKKDCIAYNQTKINNSLLLWYDLSINKTSVLSNMSLNNEDNFTKNNLILNYSDLISTTPKDSYVIDSLLNSKKNNKPYDILNKAQENCNLSALTRVLPFSFFAKSDLEAWVYGAQQGALTHGGENNWHACAVLSLFIFKMLKEHKRIKSKWKNIKGDKETFDKFYRQNIDIEKVLNSTINVTSNFKNTANIIEKLKITLKKIKGGNDNKDVLSDYELHEIFGDGSDINDLLCVILYIGCVAKTFEIALEISLNNNYEQDSLASLVAPLYLILHKGASLDYIFNEIEGNIQLEDFLYNIKRNISDINFRMLTKNDVSKEEIGIFVQMKAFEKVFEPEMKNLTWQDKLKKFLKIT